MDAIYLHKRRVKKMKWIKKWRIQQLLTYQLLISKT